MIGIDTGGQSSSRVRPIGTRPSCSLATPAPQHGSRPSMSTSATRATAPAGRPVRSGSSGAAHRRL